MQDVMETINCPRCSADNRRTAAESVRCARCGAVFPNEPAAQETSARVPFAWRTFLYPLLVGVILVTVALWFVASLEPIPPPPPQGAEEILRQLNQICARVEEATARGDEIEARRLFNELEQFENRDINPILSDRAQAFRAKLTPER